MEFFFVNSLVFAYRITDLALQSTEKVMQHKVSAPYGDKKCDKKQTVSASDLKYKTVFGLVEIPVEAQSYPVLH